jgi:mevalonate kinase
LKEPISYSAKLLLFGEYSILLGSRALSIPYPRFSGSLVSPDGTPLAGKELLSNKELKKFLSFLKEKPDHFSLMMELNAFEEEVERGLFFDSDIPVGYGIGSSGAICAAVYERFGTHQIPGGMDGGEAMAHVKKRLGTMESFFHGKSSGFDPLVIYYNRPLTIAGDGGVSVAVIKQSAAISGLDFFLVDTGQRSKTHALVTEFLTRYSPDGVVSNEGKTLSRLANACVDGLINGEHALLRDSVKQLSVLQLSGFRRMIPDSFVSHWKEGLDSGLFSLKLCGSGGGGYLLGITHKWADAAGYFASHNHFIEKVSFPNSQSYIL